MYFTPVSLFSFRFSSLFLYFYPLFSLVFFSGFLSFLSLVFTSFFSLVYLSLLLSFTLCYSLLLSFTLFYHYHFVSCSILTPIVHSLFLSILPSSYHSIFLPFWVCFLFPVGVDRHKYICILIFVKTISALNSRKLKTSIFFMFLSILPICFDSIR